MPERVLNADTFFISASRHGVKRRLAPLSLTLFYLVGKAQIASKKLPYLVYCCLLLTHLCGAKKNKIHRYGLEANPSFIRKLMVPLTRDGIIVSTLGRNGSIHLGRPAEEITLRDIYVSVIEDKKLWASRPDVPARCVVSANACWYFKSIADEAEQASLQVLARHTVASALEEVKKADTSGCDPVPELIAKYKEAH